MYEPQCDANSSLQKSQNVSVWCQSVPIRAKPDTPVFEQDRGNTDSPGEASSVYKLLDARLVLIPYLVLFLTGTLKRAFD